MKQKLERGRPAARYVKDALAHISQTEDPVSTHQLIKLLGLTEHEGIHLRRELRRAEGKGLIQMVIRSPDGSFTWLPNHVSIASCAGHAANLYLEREKADTKIDPRKFEEMLNDGQLQT